MSDMTVAGYCVYPSTEDFDRTLIGDRRTRDSGKYTVIYCDSEDDANELSRKIEGSMVGAYYHLGGSSEPDENGTVLY